MILDRESDIHTAIHRFFRAHSNFHMIGIFWHSVFHLMFVEIRFLIPLLEHFRCRAPFHLGPCSDGHSIQFNFLCKVLIWPRHIFRLCQISDTVRLRPTLDVVGSSMTFNSRWSSTLENQFCQRRVMLLF